MTNKEIIERISAVYPKFSKVQLSMVHHESLYGICLCPNAKRLIQKNKPTQTKAKTDDRKKLTVRIEPTLYDKLKEVMIRSGYKSINDLITNLITKEVE